jgi:hypothetical protein
MATIIPFSLENQTGSSIVLRDLTILDGTTYEIPLKETFYNDVNAGVFNRDFTDITILGTNNLEIIREDFWDVFNSLQNSNIININTQGIESIREGIPTNVADEEARDSLFPNPAEGLKVYNERLNLVEKYYSEFGLWLNAHLIVVQNTAGLDVARVVWSESESEVNSIQYINMDYPEINSDREDSYGALIQNGINDFSSMAVSGKWFIEHGETISINEYVRAKTSGSNSDVGKLQGSSGTSNGIIGRAVEDSGATTGKSDFTLVLINVENR